MTIRCPTLSRIAVVADDPHLAAALSCALAQRGAYLAVMDGPRLTRYSQAYRRAFSDELLEDIPAALALLCAPVSASSQSRDLRAERQATIGSILRGSGTSEGIVRARGSCASGQQPASIAERRSAGALSLPDAADYCVTVLTRLGREGRLGFVRDTRNPTVTSALAFDNGFVTAYQRREPIAAGLPGMAALKPIAERCLALAERDTELCFSAGYAYGVRAANGETVTVR